jgi:hypothetical protein
VHYKPWVHNYKPWVHNSGVVIETGRIHSITPERLLMKTRSRWEVHIKLADVRQIVGANKSRSKQDKSLYGEYRVYYEIPTVEIDDEGTLDFANTMRRLLAMA